MALRLTWFPAEAVVSRVLAFHILSTFHEPAFLPSVLRSFRGSMFPNYVSASVDTAHTRPQGEQIQEMAVGEVERKAAIAILNCVPRPVAKFYFAAHSNKQILQEREGEENEKMIGVVVNEILDPFENAYANRHLIYGIMELIISAVMPELQVGTDDDAGGSIARLLEERGVNFSDE
ncbi:MAG: hypothetical protein Q9162_004718 [Coniocarpon cinnabarinum]